MNIIDTHIHLTADPNWITSDRFRSLQRAFTVIDLAEATSGTGVTTAVAVTAAPTLEETSRVLGLAGHNDLIEGVTGWVDLTQPDVAHTLATLTSGPHGRHLRAIRHPTRKEASNEWLRRDDVVRGLRAVAEAGLAFELLIRLDQMPTAIDLSRDLPELQFVLDHCGLGPHMGNTQQKEWATHIGRLAAHHNVACKLSGPVLYPAQHPEALTNGRHYVDVVLDAFGSERVMFGSNWPICLVAGTYDQPLQSAQSLIEHLSQVEAKDILLATAQRVYGLPA